MNQKDLKRLTSDEWVRIYEYINKNKFSVNASAEILGIIPKTLQRNLKKYLEKGEIVPPRPGQRGRPPLVSLDTIARAKEKVEEGFENKRCLRDKEVKNIICELQNEENLKTGSQHRLTPDSGAVKKAMSNVCKLKAANSALNPSRMAAISCLALAATMFIAVSVLCVGIAPYQILNFDGKKCEFEMTCDY